MVFTIDKGMDLCRLCYEGEEREKLARFCACQFAHESCVMNYISDHSPNCPACKTNYVLEYQLLPFYQWRCGRFRLCNWYLSLIVVIIVFMATCIGIYFALIYTQPSSDSMTTFQHTMMVCAISVVCGVLFLVFLFFICLTLPDCLKDMKKLNYLVYVKEIPDFSTAVGSNRFLTAPPSVLTRPGTP